jgi:NCAIR mutase (PurE)-related protein
MTGSELQTLLDRVRRGDLDPSAAAGLVLTALRSAPFEDLGFARVDTHRAVRQGFPEVILGLGKTPAQIAAIAETLVARGQALLVTRADAAVFEAVRATVPGAAYHETARAITLTQGHVPDGKGTIMVACAGTSDLPIAEEAVVTLELMGNRVDRLYDVGVAFTDCCPSSSASRPPASSSWSPAWKARCRAWSPVWSTSRSSRCPPASATAPASAVSRRCWVC